jgi:hypothetical protein
MTSAPALLLAVLTLDGALRLKLSTFSPALAFASDIFVVIMRRATAGYNFYDHALIIGRPSPTPTQT